MRRLGSKSFQCSKINERMRRRIDERMRRRMVHHASIRALLYTWLTRRWKAPNLQFSKNFFLGTIWGTTFGCKVTFVRFVDIFFIQKLK